jgi:three-Cys-motif partner protein
MVHKDILDVINLWSEIKLEIIKKYAHAYSTIISTQAKLEFKHTYIDAFAGPGLHISKRSGELVPGSPLNALNVEPKFAEYHFIDLDNRKVEALREIADQQSNVWVYEEDCNEVLIEKVFPRVKYEDYKRGLCLLDPYGLDLDWKIIQTAGEMKSIEIFLNFPIHDINRNVLFHDPSNVSEAQKERMTRYWGGETWKDAAYSSKYDLFGKEEKVRNEILAEEFRKRLMEKAGFRYVPKPLPMRNSKKADIYYLFFASPKPVAAKIIDDIFNKYRRNGLI